MKRREQQLAASLEIARPTVSGPKVSTQPMPEYTMLTQNDQTLFAQTAKTMMKTSDYNVRTAQQYHKTVAVLREMRRQAELQFDDKEANKIDKAIRGLSETFLLNQLYTSKLEQCGAIKSMLQIEMKKLEKKEALYAEKYQNYEKERELALKKVEEECKARIEEFENSFPSVLPTEYAKLSSGLLNLGAIEQTYRRTRQFKEAGKLHKEYVQKENEELNDRKLEFIRARDKRLEQIRKRNQRALDAITSLYDTKKAELDDESSKCLNAIKLAISNLEKKLLSAESEYVGEGDPVLMNKDVTKRPATAREKTNMLRKTLTVSSHSRPLWTHK